MKPITIQQLSFIGLLLFMASAITAAVLPRNVDKKTNNGHFVVSSDGADLTCINGLAVGPCTYTQTLAHGIPANYGLGSRTSAVQTGNGTSTITLLGGTKVKSVTEASSNIPVNDLHSSNDGGL